MRQLLLFLLGMACLAGCNQDGGKELPGPETADFDLGAARNEIAGTYPAFSDAAVKGDSATIHEMYHSQSKVYPPNSPVMEGPAAAASLFGSFKGMGLTQVKTQTTEVLGGPQEVVELGTYELFSGSNAVDKGKYMVVWKKENGKWKNYRDMWNSDNPAIPK